MHDDRPEYDVIVVGAGLAGCYALYRLRELGLSVRVFETGEGVGGTWYWNRYPGCRCDVESLHYSYSFSEELEQDWHWTERYPTQPEILAYINHVADRFDLWPDIQFATRVSRLAYDELAGGWDVETDRGLARARFVVTAVGCLSDRHVPSFVGLECFEGETFHTGSWPDQTVDFSGNRVGVIGTGSSAIQAIPMIAAQAEHLVVFQRTANFSIPAGQRALAPHEERDLKARYRAIRQQARESWFGYALEIPSRSALDESPEERWRRFDSGWGVSAPAVALAYNDVTTNEEANASLVGFIHDKIRDTVTDPAVADVLCPKDHPFGAKRVCCDTDYFATYNRPNVTLVDIKAEPIERITPGGVVAGGREYEFDAIVFATGYDAVTGPLNKIEIRGRGGRLLRQEWTAGPRSYLGIQIVGFPNLFTITGPGSPSVVSNMIVSIEQHVDWIADAIAYLRDRSLDSMEPAQAAQDAWVEHVAEIAAQSLFHRGNSWYVGANIPGKPRVVLPYVGGVWEYRKKCDAVASAGYDGFELRSTQDRAAEIER
jgi:cyclohexanone monooxygenase